MTTYHANVTAAAEDFGALAPGVDARWEGAPTWDDVVSVKWELTDTASVHSPYYGEAGWVYQGYHNPVIGYLMVSWRGENVSDDMIARADFLNMRRAEFVDLQGNIRSWAEFQGQLYRL